MLSINLSVSLLIWGTLSSIDSARWQFSLFSSDASLNVLILEAEVICCLTLEPPQYSLQAYIKLTEICKYDSGRLSDMQFLLQIENDFYACFYTGRNDWHSFSVNHHFTWVLEIIASLRTNSKKSVLKKMPNLFFGPLRRLKTTRYFTIRFILDGTLMMNLVFLDTCFPWKKKKEYRKP